MGILPGTFARLVTLLSGKIIADAKVCWLRGTETKTGLSSAGCQRGRQEMMQTPKWKKVLLMLTDWPTMSHQKQTASHPNGLQQISFSRGVRVIPPASPCRITALSYHAFLRGEC